MRQFTVLIALTGVLGVASIRAQSRPDFSGRWAMVGDDTSARGLAGLLVGICGAACDIRQDASTLTIKRTPAARVPMPAVLTIDWTQSRVLPMAGGGAAPSPRIEWTSEWKGEALIITSTETVVGTHGDIKTETRHTLSLNRGDLQIATALARPSAAGTFTPTLIYRKSPAL